MTPNPTNGSPAPQGQEQQSSILSEVVEVTLRERQQRLRLDKEHFDFRQRQANLFVRSGLFQVKERGQPIPADQAVAQAVVKMELGASMGFSDAEALQGIYVINGVTAISSALRAARMQAAGYGWDVEFHGTHNEPTGCTLWLYYRGQPIHARGNDGQAKVSFLKSDAERMLTTMDGKRVSILEKDNWRNSPASMYFARAVSNAQRWYAPACLSANLPSVEEAEDMDPGPERAFGVFPISASAEPGSGTVQRETLKDRLKQRIEPDAPLPDTTSTYQFCLDHYSQAPKHIVRIMNMMQYHPDPWSILGAHGIDKDNFGAMTKETAELIAVEMGVKK